MGHIPSVFGTSSHPIDRVRLDGWMDHHHRPLWLSEVGSPSLTVHALLFDSTLPTCCFDGAGAGCVTRGSVSVSVSVCDNISVLLLLDEDCC